MVRIKASTFSRLGKAPRDFSKKDLERITKGLDPIQSEDDAQIKLVSYLEDEKKAGRIIQFTAIPNSTRTPYKKVRIKNLKMGLRKGLPDIFLVYHLPGSKAYNSAFIEMKREDGTASSVRKEQKEWISTLNKTY